MGRRILICFTGSVATLKVPEICVLLLDAGHEIRIVGSSSASYHFLERSKYYNPKVWERFLELDCHSRIITDSDEWKYWNVMGDPVVHIELRKWADILLVVPASADILAKLSSGLTDNLLLSVARAWDFRKPCFVCPAMNTLMWEHPVTLVHLETLQYWGWKVIHPVVKTLACNDHGSGALAPVAQILDTVGNAIYIETAAVETPIIELIKDSKKKIVTQRDDRYKYLNHQAILSIAIPVSFYIVSAFMKNR